MSARLAKAWRFWRNGCIPVDYPAGSVLEDPHEIEVARQCGVLEEVKAPEEEAPKKRAKKKEE